MENWILKHVQVLVFISSCRVILSYHYVFLMLILCDLSLCCSEIFVTTCIGGTICCAPPKILHGCKFFHPLGCYYLFQANFVSALIPHLSYHLNQGRHGTLLFKYDWSESWLTLPFAVI